MIDEKILLRALRGFYEREREYKLVADEKGIHYEPQTGLIDEIIKYVQKMPKVGEWIPCSERLPEKSLNLKVICKNGGSSVAYYTGKNWYDCFTSAVVDVVVWKEPSEPWEGEE